MKCNFRNCLNEFECSLTKKYCSKKCKDKENIYLKRDTLPKKKRGRKIGQVKYKLLINLTEQEILKLSNVRSN